MIPALAARRSRSPPARRGGHRAAAAASASGRPRQVVAGAAGCGQSSAKPVPRAGGGLQRGLFRRGEQHHLTAGPGLVCEDAGEIPVGEPPRPRACVQRPVDLVATVQLWRDRPPRPSCAAPAARPPPRPGSATSPRPGRSPGTPAPQPERGRDVAQALRAGAAGSADLRSAAVPVSSAGGARPQKARDRGERGPRSAAHHRRAPTPAGRSTGVAPSTARRRR